MKEYLENRITEFLKENLKDDQWGHTPKSPNDVKVFLSSIQVIEITEKNCVLVYPNGIYNLDGNDIIDGKIKYPSRFQYKFCDFLKSLNREIKLKEILE